MNGATALKQLRRQEAELLVCRLISEHNRLCRDLAEIAEESRNAALMSGDPSLTADNLRGVTPELMYFDLQRLLTLIREGF